MKTKDTAVPLHSTEYREKLGLHFHQKDKDTSQGTNTISLGQK